MGIEYHVSKREDYSKDLIDWCDAIIAAGGDGTFLYAAGLHTLDCSKPVIGINSDPERYVRDNSLFHKDYFTYAKNVTA